MKLNNTTEKTVETLKLATAAHRASYVARAEELHIERLVSMRASLAAAGMDLNKVAPRPNTNCGKSQYRFALAKHNNFRAVFQDDKNAPETADSRMFPMKRFYGEVPWIVVEKPDAEAKLRAEARAEANLCFDAYLYKLAGKIGTPILAATMTGGLWNGSTLTVTLESGDIQVWTTKRILNVSVYGKLFNQWPTRRVDQKEVA